MPGFFEKKGFSEKTRNLLYIFICIPLRLLIAIGFLFYAMDFIEKKSFEIPVQENNYFFEVVLILSILYTLGAIYSDFTNPNVWWSRKIHILFSSIVVFLSISGLILNSSVNVENKEINLEPIIYSIVGFLFIDAIVGLIFRYQK